MDSGDIEKQKEEEIRLIVNEKSNFNYAMTDDKELAFLTREDLIRLDMKEPIWRRARIGLLICFWIVWLGLLAASVIIIVLSPKCPPTPTLEFWQEKVGYWIDPFAFKDSDGDLIGDFKGTPVIYYGAELNTTYASRMDSPKGIYPNGKVPFPNLDDRDSVLSCHLPMPWDRTGKGFSEAVEKKNFTNYLRNFEITETVQSTLSVGREPNLFSLMKQLIKLRQNPSLLWGQFRRIFEQDNYGSEVFVRQAEGFPQFIIAFVRDPSVGSRVYDFSSVCSKVRNHVVFPPKSTFPKNVYLRSDRIYVDAVNRQPSLYVFECIL